jgi:uncharacterized protein (DUF1697 family)
MTHIALLRAINLGAYNKVAMGDLRDLLSSLGMEDPVSLLQSGNLVFRTTPQPTIQLERLLEKAAATRLRLETDFFVRTGKEWKAIIAGNPFPSEAKRDPGHLLVVCLKDPPGRAAIATLQDAIVGREVVRAKGREAYIVYPDGVGRSRLTAALIEKKLGTRGTARNWNTVLKLGALAVEL